MDKIKIKNPLVYLLVLPIKIYQILVSPMLSSNCRFHPTCSQYSIDSFYKFGVLKGLYYSIIRLKSCHPFGKTGYDPVREKIIFKKVPLDMIKEIRKKNLYQNLPKSMAKYKEDKYESTQHFGLYSDDIFVSGLTIIEQRINTKHLKCFQIRGMFTVKGKYNKGYGSELISNLIKVLKKKK